jgi:hypothetical protein
MTQQDARAIVNVYCIPIGRDFHSLNSQHVQNILDAANARKYRAPRGANGSRCRYFYAYLMRSLGV